MASDLYLSKAAGGGGSGWKKMEGEERERDYPTISILENDDQI